MKKHKLCNMMFIIIFLSESPEVQNQLSALLLMNERGTAGRSCC